MDGVYKWVSNIVYYLVFVTMLTNLLPAGKYEKYLRLFAGCILILLVIQPVTGGLRLEEKISGIFNELSFKNDMGELNAELAEMEEKRMQEVINRYEEAAAEDIGRMTDIKGYTEQAVSVQIEDQESSPDFGKIKQVTVLLKSENGGVGEEKKEIAETIGEIEKIETIRIGENEGELSSSLVSAPGIAESADIRTLRQEIAEYYQMEEQNVEIKLQNE